MKNRKILSAVVTAAILVGSVTPSTVFAESSWTSDPAPAANNGISAQAELSKAPVGYGGLTLTANAGGDVYGVTVTADQLKTLKFSPADSNAGRGNGYHVGFHVDALDTGMGASGNSYARINTYTADLADATIKGLSYSAGSSTDGQFWTGYQYSWLKAAATATRPYLVYAVKAAIGGSDVYYYIAVDCSKIPDDFTFEDCGGSHTADTACTICGKFENVKVTNGTAADAKGTVTIKDAAGAAVTEAAKNDKITITVTPDEGYVLDTLKINDTAVEVTNGTYTYTMTGADTTVTATFKEIAVESVELDQTTAELKVGDTTALKATVKPDNAANKTVTWTSDKTDIATVDADGKVTAKAVGTATITATCGEKTATCTVEVTAKEYAVTVPAKTDEGEVKTDKAKAVKGTKITLTVTPGEGYELDALTVDGTKVTVTGSTYSFDMPEKDVAVTATFKKTEVAVESVALDQTTAELKVGDTVALKATVKPDNAANKTVAWTSSDEKVATVKDGVVTGVARGTATITAKCDEKTATCKVSVNEEEIISAAAPKTFAETAADGTKTENVVKVLPAAEVSAAKSVTVTVTSSDGKWTASKEITKCYKTVKHTAADGTTDTLSAGDDYMIAVHVTGIPDGVTVKYSFTFNK